MVPIKMKEIIEAFLGSNVKNNVLTVSRSDHFIQGKYTNKHGGTFTTCFLELIFVDILSRRVNKSRSCLFPIICVSISRCVAFIVTRKCCFLYLTIALTMSVGTYSGFFRTRIKKKFNIRMWVAFATSLQSCIVSTQLCKLTTPLTIKFCFPDLFVKCGGRCLILSNVMICCCM
ncbi:uncharacterized protein [Spinacia oleracea]|uniref:Uncharacterized protein n=1 Tax=Spinacia oleracea TaxID=3562 RepID=A0ABM3QNX0_SPIOL|nr:uncharacterized protein LOC110785184 [Spinacia oleracea]